VNFKKATREKAKARMCFIGPSGSGKTYSALEVAQFLGDKVALIDTEHGSASKYSEKGFDVCELTNFSARNFIMAIKDCEAQGYNVLIIDSLSHAWVGKGGILEMVDRETEKTGNKFMAWNKGTKLQNELINVMLDCKMHLLVTMRSKTEYVVEKNDKGKNVPRKVGMGAVQRADIEYEFDVIGELTQDNTYNITKTRCSELQEMSFPKPGKELAEIYKAWLDTGVKPKKKTETGEATPSETDEDPNETREEDPNKKGFPKESDTATKKTTSKKTTAKKAPAKESGATRSVEGVLAKVTKSGERYSLHLEGGGGPFVTYSKPAMQRACTFKRQNIRIHFTINEVDGETQFNCISFELVEK